MGLRAKFNRFQLLQRLEPTDEGIGGLWVTSKLPFCHIILDMGLERQWVFSEQIDNHEEVSFEFSLVCFHISVRQSFLTILIGHIRNLNGVLRLRIGTRRSHFYLL